MDSHAVTVRTVVDALAPALALRWHGTPTGGDNRLDQPAGGETVPKVGYLNFIHPPRVQIIGAAEADYLRQASPALRDHIIDRVRTGDTAMIVIADGMGLEEPHALALQSAGIALLATDIPAHKVSYRMRHYLSQALARRITVHGVFLEILSIGLLLTGRPAVGKSELALELITRGHRLVADDAPEFALLGPDDLNGGCPPVLQDFLEVRGLGVLNIRAMFGEAAIKRRKQLGLIINLLRPDDPDLPVTDRLSGSRRERDILEVGIPEITLPVAPGHNLAVLVEAACRDHLLRQQGHRSDEIFAARQAAHMQDGAA
ncbi:HPr(Ser) kinase/phosphatase [Spectribacter hydrogenoxidans]|uniref:HPr(Ser) kinase/phosphatase n=1 Tax=Spectribacter hydrogenoxidans TaxID=3075608 RepID=A0ABU3BX07_9GAMM|nr:HPr(Ser) kinase/phosphatase [Salinisphaera sp. W335]MDT0633840.1 HPr(Ser) kinase/phosphatase [Salinisphaera sp. W335]